MNYVNLDKIDCTISMFPNNFFINTFTYIKISKDSSANYYQNNKNGTTKKACEKYQSFSNKEKKEATIWSLTVQKSTRR